MGMTAYGWPGQSVKKLRTVPWEKREGARAAWWYLSWAREELTRHGALKLHHRRASCWQGDFLLELNGKVPIDPDAMANRYAMTDKSCEGRVRQMDEKVGLTSISMAMNRPD
jgi:hypothetical protein